MRRIVIGLLLCFCVSSLVFAKSKVNNSLFKNKGMVSTDTQAAIVKYNQDMIPRLPAWPWKMFNVTPFGNFDITPKTMQKTLAGEEHDYFALSNIGINIDATYTKYFMAHVGLAYFKTNKGQGDRYSNTGVVLDDAFFAATNFVHFPVFAEVGLFYLPFGTNDRYAMVQSLAQLLSITRAAGAQVGVVNWHGFTGSLYLSQGQLKTANKKIQGAINGGAALHYNYGSASSFHLMAGAEFIYNMLQVNALAESRAFTIDRNPATTDGNYVYSKKIPGAAAQIQAGYKWVTLFGQYVTALKKSNDLVLRYQTPTTLSNPVYGAKPRAWDAGARVNFKLFNRDNQLDFTYSRSNQTAGLYIFNSTRNHVMPKERYIVGYTLNVNRYLLVRLQWAHDELFSPANGDTGRQGDDATLRIGVRY
ncbi:MAG: LbtU family siderophore porin [Gammaproteobacteria bacterium]|nr:LbtU family siderophore porin [Gammaproteobacteria bacterium]